VYCSQQNSGAEELADELNATFDTSKARRRRSTRVSRCAQVSSVSARLVSRRSSRFNGVPEAFRGRLLEIVGTLDECDHMLVYLNALTWTHEPEAFAAEVHEAMRLGVHLQLCHEFNSVLDPGSTRHALPFKEIMDATPPDLKKGPRNIYSQIAIALKGGELRDVGLATLASKLVQRVPRAPISDELPDHPSSNSPAGLLISKAITVAEASSKQLMKPLTKTASLVDDATRQLVRKAPSIEVLATQPPAHQTEASGGIAMASSASV